MSDGENRAKKLDKKKKQYTGGSFSAQSKRAEVNRHYENEPIDNAKKRVRIKEKDK